LVWKVLAIAFVDDLVHVNSNKVHDKGNDLPFHPIEEGGNEETTKGLALEDCSLNNTA
jgi:hypothetical protein